MYATVQAQLLVESAGAMRSKVAREGAFAMLAACALRHGQLEAVAGALVAALPRNEHLGALLPELAEYAEARHRDASLVSERRHSACMAAHALPLRSQPSWGCCKGGQGGATCWAHGSQAVGRDRMWEVSEEPLPGIAGSGGASACVQIAELDVHAARRGAPCWRRWPQSARPSTSGSSATTRPRPGACAMPQSLSRRSPTGALPRYARSRDVTASNARGSSMHFIGGGVPAPGAAAPPARSREAPRRVHATPAGRCCGDAVSVLLMLPLTRPLAAHACRGMHWGSATAEAMLW